MATEREAVRTCKERVPEPPGYWHDHACGRKAKWWVRVNVGTTTEPEYRRRPVCGTHVKWHEKHGEVLGPIEPEAGPEEGQK